MISLYTFTLGRTRYLNALLQSVLDASIDFDGTIEHHVCYQGTTADPSTVDLVKCAFGPVEFHLHEWDRNYGIAEGMNRIVPELPGDVIGKIDDDCVIQSHSFFQHLEAVATLKPAAVFSPFPVGLITFVGGPPAIDRHVAYSDRTDTYYTFRRVDHIGGFCRFGPGDLERSWRMRPYLTTNGTEDRQHSALCLSEGVEMLYLENALIVEHNESSLGQQARDGRYEQMKAESRGDYRELSLRQRVLRGSERRLFNLLRKFE